MISFLVIISFSCSKNNSASNNLTNRRTTAIFDSSVNYGTVTDQDGNIYKTITIGAQTWMAENLRTTIYNDGTSIPNIKDSDEWSNSTIGGFCNYNNTTNSDTIATFGRLYNWYAVNTGKLAPKGWHVATDEEWRILTIYLGESVAGGKLKEIGKIHWNSPNTGATNKSGFTALPGGSRHYDGTFFGIGDVGFWWCTPESNISNAWYWYIYYDINHVCRHFLNREYGFSIRCVKD